MEKPTVITVLGAGYVGLTSAAIFAHAGYRVYLVEPNLERLNVIKSGKSFFYEQGIDALIAPAVQNGSLLPTDSYDECIPTSDIVFSCVGTPDNPDGSSNLSYVFDAARHTAELAQSGLVFVQKSTVPVGTGAKLIEIFAQSGKQIHYVSNPEFLREGTAVSDTLQPDRIVAGGDNADAIERVLSIYRSVEKHRDSIAERAGLDKPTLAAAYVTTTLSSAELVKVASNAFLALKISFANSIAKLADKSGADITSVMDAVGADPRIGRAFLNAGRGYGGGCFPKDVSGLIASGLAHGVDLDIMRAAQEENESMPGYIVEKLQDALDGDLSNKKVAVLGLAFKAGTSDVRKSPGIVIANLLHEHGAVVTVHDPEVNGEAREDLADEIIVCDSASQALADVESVVVATDWSHYLEHPADWYARSAKVFVDAMNRFSPDDIKAAGMTYIGVGRS